MTKSELKTGMIVTYRCGWKRIIFLNTCWGQDTLHSFPQDTTGAGWAILNEFNDDLTCVNNPDMDIMVVEELLFFSDIWSENPRTTVVWERKEKKQYTYAQLKEIIGEDFEIVE